MDTKIKTSFLTIYDSFLNRVTDDMYMELTEMDTYQMLQDLLINSISAFEFPKFNLYDYEVGYIDDLGTYCGVESNYVEVPATGWIAGYFNAELTQEEINIISLNMVVEWFGQQLAVTENTKMKYTGSDFKMSSQANHMAKLKLMIDHYKQESHHLQRVYCRREINNGKTRSTARLIMTTPTYGLNI